MKILSKIRYRLAFNRAHRLNRQGEGLVQIEMEMQGRRRYLSTNVYVRPDQWQRGMVVNHPLSDQLNYALQRQRMAVEEVELEYIRRGVQVSLWQMQDAVRRQLSPSARLYDFGRAMTQDSDRREHTKQGYMTLLNSIERFRKGTLVTDIDYPFLQAYEQWMHGQKLAHNTIVSRLRLLRAVMSEAMRQEIVSKNPFDNFHIGMMQPRRGYVTADNLARLEQLQLVGREAMVRDAFLFCCYTGLRFSDFISLRSHHLADGWIKKEMVKTSFTVEIPYRRLFQDKAQGIIDRYHTIEGLSMNLPSNAQVNVTIRKLMTLIHQEGNITFHSSRHTFATLLSQQGVSLDAIQQMLGHRSAQTTQIYRERDRSTLTAALDSGERRPIAVGE